MIKSLVGDFSLDSIPPVVRRFLLRALVIFLVWKAAYHLVLLPARVPDHQLTSVTANTTAWMYEKVSGQAIQVVEVNDGVGLPKSMFFINGQRSIAIADPCNALELFVLYLGFLLCLPQPWKKMLKYAVGGIAAIFVMNILRCMALTWLNLHQYAITDIAHHYIFKMVVYAAIFFIWVRYSKGVFGHVS